MTDIPVLPEATKEIVAYLNQKTGKDFRARNQKTQKVINARINEGYELADFKKVIDLKTKEWLHDPKMCIYLRPETLFGTKFEGYLNSIPANQPSEHELKMRNAC